MSAHDTSAITLTKARAAAARADADALGDIGSRLAAALGVGVDCSGSPNLAESIRVLHRAGVTAEAAEVVEWLPALDVAWQGGVDVVERDRLFAVAGLGAASVAAMDLMGNWCVTRPATEVFAAGLIILRYRLERLPKDDRDLLFARVIGACDTIANAAGGWTGFRRVSTAERCALHKARTVLRGNASQLRTACTQPS